MSISLQSHRLKHIRFPCPSLSPEVCSNSCPLSWWCHPNISSSVTPSPLSLNLFWHQSLFQRVGSLYQVAKVLELKLQHHSFQWIFRVDFLKDWLVWSPCSPRDSKESSPAPRFKSINSSLLSLLYGPTLTSVHDYWKIIVLTTWTFVGKAMSLLLNMLSRFVITFFQRGKHLLISWLQSLSAVVFEAQENKILSLLVVANFLIPWDN